MMKTIRILIAASLITAGTICAAYADGDAIGEVYTTDIGAIIDGSPIKSYNISDSTYIKAEDLRGYGFMVEWEGDARKLTITPDSTLTRTVLPENEINIKKADIPVHKKLYDVYATDIKTYLGDKEVESCNISGETLIAFRDLEYMGYVSYYDGDRIAMLETIAAQLEAGCQAVENPQQLEMGTDITYIGDVKNNMPDGYGTIDDFSVEEGEKRVENNMHTIAHFTESAISGLYDIEGAKQYSSESGSEEYFSVEYGNTDIFYSIGWDNYNGEEEHFNYFITSLTDPNDETKTGVELKAVLDMDYLYNITTNYEGCSYTRYENGVPIP